VDDKKFWTANRKVWLAAHILVIIVVVVIILVARSQ
jgi:hypothetical protein